MTRLALLRHAPTAWNRAGRLQGRVDEPLDELSRAHLAGLRLPSPFASLAVVSSPLRRAAETATLLASPPRIEPALIEMDWGAWEGRRGADLAADPQSGYRHIEDWGWDFLPPGGETPAQVRARLQPWLYGLAAPTLAVTHVGVMRVLMAMATGWEFSGAMPFKVKRDRLYLLDVRDGRVSPADEPVRLEARCPG